MTGVSFTSASGSDPSDAVCTPVNSPKTSYNTVAWAAADVDKQPSTASPWCCAAYPSDVLGKASKALRGTDVGELGSGTASGANGR